MILKFEQTEVNEQENIILKVQKHEGEINEFDYISFIKEIYEGEEITDVEFPEDMEEQQKENLKNMIDKINAVIQESFNSSDPEIEQTVEEED